MVTLKEQRRLGVAVFSFAAALAFASGVIRFYQDRWMLASLGWIPIAVGLVFAAFAAYLDSVASRTPNDT